MFETLRNAFGEGLFGRAPGKTKIATLAELQAALPPEAAHVGQSATFNYLRARTGFMGPKLFSETAFLEAVEITRWEAYGAVLADLVMIAEAASRAWLPGASAPAIWIGLYEEGLAAYPPPAHRADGWRGLQDAFAARLATRLAAPPEPPDLIAVTAGQTIYAHLPLHPDVRRPDEEMVINTVRFRMLRSWESLKERLEWPTIAAEIRRMPSAQ